MNAVREKDRVKGRQPSVGWGVTPGRRRRRASAPAVLLATIISHRILLQTTAILLEQNRDAEPRPVHQRQKRQSLKNVPGGTDVNWKMKIRAWKNQDPCFNFHKPIYAVLHKYPALRIAIKHECNF